LNVGGNRDHAPSGESLTLPQPLCRPEEIPDRQARGFTVDTPEGKRDILVHRDGDAIRAYFNSCPHNGSPLDWGPDKFISLDKYHIICGTHGALFRPEDGYCVDGPCAGDSLEAVPVALIAGVINYTG
jgi:nitrite reductase/ring-hydroxylating ferredoxin subunit